MKIKLPLTLFCLFLISCEKGDIEIFDSKPIFSSSLNGEWILVNYWADWCPPCIKEIPELHELDNNNSNIRVFLFNFDRLEGEELEQQLLKFNIELPALLTDPKNYFPIVTPDALPVSYLINPNLKLSKVLNGPQTELSILEAIQLIE